MKFDPFIWQEEKPNEKIQVGKGRVRLRLSVAAPVYFEAEGVEALVGTGTAFDFEVSEPGAVTVEAKSGRVFRHVGHATSERASGEVYTNIDRMVDESGALAEVTRARRLFELERRAFLRDLHAARDKAIAEVVGKPAAVEPAAVPAVEPAAVEPEATE